MQGREFIKMFLFGVAVCACASTSSPGDPVLTVGGDYPTAVTLVTSTCTGITVQSQPTSVSHASGSNTVVLTHAGLAYNGTVATTGVFTTTPKAVTAGNDTHTLTISGQFTTSGFTATVAAAVTGSGNPACAYSVQWVGTKTGSPNVIPG